MPVSLNCISLVPNSLKTINTSLLKKLKIKKFGKYLGIKTECFLYNNNNNKNLKFTSSNHMRLTCIVYIVTKILCHINSKYGVMLNFCSKYKIKCLKYTYQNMIKARYFTIKFVIFNGLDHKNILRSKMYKHIICSP